ncbi:DUF4235 domain-containing protein [Cellulomonas fimi]|uniref:DUF4235 domain-containing protein n=1 Tax=Cellulomonas fimi TaxID=1708 RepID=UPI00235A3254|nr:DUF4235 domain-containing protein [Cellulomonas fimi]
MDKQSTVSKLVGVGAALAAAWIAQQVVAQGWKATRGYAPPKPEDEGDYRLGEVIAAAAITGALVGVARALATRGTAAFTARTETGRDLVD